RDEDDSSSEPERERQHYPIEPDIQQLCLQFGIDAELTQKLNDIMIEDRQKTWEQDMDKLLEVLKGAHTPRALLAIKLKDMEKGVFVGKAKCGEAVRQMARKHRLDKGAATKLEDAMSIREAMGKDVDKDLQLLDEHLAASNKPSALISMKLESLRKGFHVGHCIYSRETLAGNQGPGVDGVFDKRGKRALGYTDADLDRRFMEEGTGGSSGGLMDEATARKMMQTSQGRSEQWHSGGWDATRSTWQEPDYKPGEQQWASSRSTWTPASTWESYGDRPWKNEHRGDWSSGWRWNDSYKDSKWEPNERHSGHDDDRSSTNTGKDFADPEKWRGWGDYRMWRRRTVLRWRTLTDVPSHKQADRLFRSLDQDLQRKLEDLDDDTLCSSWGFDAIIKRLDLRSGERHGDERRKVARECSLDYSRKQGENLTEYCARVDTAFDRVATQGLPLPDEWKLMFLEEGVSLDERSAQMVKVLMRDQKDYKSALWAIREMDISHREHLKARRTYATMGSEAPLPQVPTYQVERDDESLLDYSDVSSMDSDGEAEVWAILESADVGEDDAPAALAAINQERRKTWRQNRDLKRQLKTDRKFYDRSGQGRGSDGREKARRPGHGAAGGAFRARKSRLRFAELIKRTRCRVCHQKGHWSRECPQKQGAGAKDEKGPPATGMTFLYANALDHSTSQCFDEPPPPTYAVVLLAVGPGAMVVDTAAGQGLVGEQALHNIEGHWALVLGLDVLDQVGKFSVPAKDFEAPASVLRFQNRSTKGSGVGRHLRLRAEQYVYFGTRQGFEFQVETFQSQGGVDSAGLEVADVGHEERPHAMTDRMQSQTDSAWVYGATGTYVPENLNRGEKGGACLAGRVLYWLARLAEEFGSVCRAKRFWPTNQPKSLRRLSEAYETYWRPPTLVNYGANSWGKWFVCSGRTMRVGYWELRPTKGTVKEEKMCLCKKKDAACTLRGQGWAQGATAEPQWQALICVPKPPPGAERAPLPLHPGMMAGGLAGGSFMTARQPAYQRVAEDAAKVTEALQKAQAEQRSAAAAARRAPSAKRKPESDTEAMDTVSDPLEEMREYQPKTERDMKGMVESQLQEMKAAIQGVMASQASQQEALERVTTTVKEQMTAIATAQGQAQEASRMIRAIAQGSSSSKAGQVKVAAAAIDSPPKAEARAPRARGAPQRPVPSGHPSSLGQQMTEPQPQSRPPLAAGAPPGVAPSAWAYIGTAPLDGTSAPAAMASQAMLHQQAAANAGAPQPTRSPALGGYPTYGPPVEQKKDAVTPPRNPDRLFTADEMPIGSAGALTTEASLSLPGTDLAAPPTAAVGPYGKGNNKGKGTPSRRPENRDPWTPGPEEKAAEKRRQEYHEWKEARWKIFHNGR
ncbi:unnamed protein product, partial [Prorocentrum cordatum]